MPIERIIKGEDLHADVLIQSNCGTRADYTFAGTLKGRGEMKGSGARNSKPVETLASAGTLPKNSYMTASNSYNRLVPGRM